MKEATKTEGIQLSIKGRNTYIYSYINNRGEDLPKEYYDSLDVKAKIKILRLLKKFSETGQMSNREKFKKLPGTYGIFEFKSDHHRILCFFLENQRLKSLVLTHGFKKEKARTPQAEIERTKSIKNGIIALEKKNVLKIYKE